MASKKRVAFAPQKAPRPPYSIESGIASLPGVRVEMEPPARMTMPRAFTKEDIRIAERFAISLASSSKGRVTSVILDRVPIPAQSMLDMRHKIPIIVLLDDLTLPLLDPDIEGYLSNVKRLVRSISGKLHVSTLKLSEHWSLCRLLAPHHLDTLRYGVAIYDKGFFDPMRYLVTKGRVRPTIEAEGVYITRADGTLKNAKNHLLQASLDLYWASIDACHAALMSKGHMPPEPADVAQELEKKLVAKGLLEQEYPKTMRLLYELSRGIMHKTVREVSGQDYDQYLAQADKLVKRMEQIVG
ncbi:MAG: hypothetical protein AABX47_06610 [Nanoarchaeota archaeon]